MPSVEKGQNKPYQEFSSIQICLNPATLHFLIRTKGKNWNLTWGCLMNSSCAKTFKECLCEQIPWDNNQLCNLSYPMILYIYKKSPTWQKSGCCPVLWYCLLFINLCGLILEQSSLYPEILMVEKVLGLPCKTHSKHLSIPKQRTIHWDNLERSK